MSFKQLRPHTRVSVWSGVTGFVDYEILTAPEYSTCGYWFVGARTMGTVDAGGFYGYDLLFFNAGEFITDRVSIAYIDGCAFWHPVTGVIG